MNRLYFELRFGIVRAFRSFVPRPEDRIPLSLAAIPALIICCVPFLFLAYLSRRSNTYLIRLLMLPTVIVTTLGPAYRYSWVIPQLNVYNWGQSLFAYVFFTKGLEFALRPEGMLKEGEKDPDGSEDSRKLQALNWNNRLLPAWLNDASEITYTLRGVGWQFGKSTYIPEEYRPKETGLFLRATARSFLVNYLLLDVLESSLKLFPGVGTPEGGSIYYQELPPFERYLTATVIHILTGSSLLCGFQMVYDLITFACVSFGSSPASWPPIIDNPWIAESMHEFWGKRWHQLLRQTFLVLGGYPGKWLGGNLGALLGTFIASGFYHEFSIYTMGRGCDFGVVGFFALQGPVLLLERIWRKFTGRKVGGWAGRLWVYFIMFVLAQRVVDSWHKRGLGGGMVIPPFISPMRVIALPILQHYLRK